VVERARSKPRGQRALREVPVSMLTVVSYDVVDDRRRSIVAKPLKDFSARMQLSVFECRLELSQLELQVRRSDGCKMIDASRKASGSTAFVGNVDHCSYERRCPCCPTGSPCHLIMENMCRATIMPARYRQIGGQVTAVAATCSPSATYLSRKRAEFAVRKRPSKTPAGR
jgi:hypothetical protein